MRVCSITLALFMVACGSGSISGNGDGGNNTAKDGGVVDAPITLADAPPGGGGDGGSRPDAARLQVNDAGQPLCDSGGGLMVCQCSDGINNDSDSFIDAADPECSGPFDNDESSFGTGIPGDNSDPYAQDCFFDGDSGGGNDGCRWDIRCTNPPDGQHCNNNQLQGCDKCRPLVPNGCDCFGCCDVYVDGVAHTVRIIDTCTTSVINDPIKCPVCTKVADCQNTCELCEVCLGHEPDPSCQVQDGGVVQVCEDPKFPCNPDSTCPSEEYRCVTGCCVKFLQ